MRRRALYHLGELVGQAATGCAVAADRLDRAARWLGRLGWRLQGPPRR